MRIVNLDSEHPAMIFLGRGPEWRHVRTLQPAEAWEAPESSEMYWAHTTRVQFGDEA